MSHANYKNPFSTNVIFLDTEFSSNDPYSGELLSLGMVNLEGEEIYLELEYNGVVSDWVKENILPTLTSEKVDRETAITKIRQFVGDDKPYAISFINIFDMIYMHKLFKSKNITDLPFKWIPIDFGSILFAFGTNPESYLPKNRREFLSKLDIDETKFESHNALDDAKLLRETYIKWVSLVKS